jgi:hypothetical protein
MNMKVKAEYFCHGGYVIGTLIHPCLSFLVLKSCSEEGSKHLPVPSQVQTTYTAKMHSVELLIVAGLFAIVKATG